MKNTCCAHSARPLARADFNGTEQPAAPSELTTHNMPLQERPLDPLPSGDDLEIWTLDLLLREELDACIARPSLRVAVDRHTHSVVSMQVQQPAAECPCRKTTPQVKEEKFRADVICGYRRELLSPAFREACAKLGIDVRYSEHARVQEHT